jgi:2-polyprenyl-3-methyl-5-hydroxy-6-metoxy-1,4-benzoquinol methylase/class 3 adenylate cyclase
VVIFLADISGYTRFMLQHEKARRHSHMIIGELLETMIKRVEVPLEISRVEGDALFLYTVKPANEEVWQRRRGQLVERVLGLFQAFAERLVAVSAYSVCRCDACANSGRLRLKVIIHSGEAVLTRVGEFPTLSGVDVILAHRLLKNSVKADEYVLMTEQAYRDLQLPAGSEVEVGEETYDVGTIKTFIYYPQVKVDYDETLIRSEFSSANVGVRILRDEVQREYTEVANDPGRGYHFNIGRAAAAITGYRDEWFEGIPEETVASFAGTGNPFRLGPLEEGEYVVDVGSGAGTDAIIAARMVGEGGHVIGVEMTEAMIAKARRSGERMGLSQLEFRQGYAEELPVPDGWADLVISNGVVNLSPTKDRVFAEMFRVLRPGGRIQIADITVERPVPESARRNIDLWTN